MTNARKMSLGSVMNFLGRERNGAFGLAARVGERIAERTEQKAKGSGGFGNSSRKPQWGSRVLRGWLLITLGEAPDGLRRSLVRKPSGMHHLFVLHAAKKVKKCTPLLFGLEIIQVA
jgi:hypothetical protein